MPATFGEATALVSIHIVSESALAAAFTEWERRFREEPDRFESESERLLNGTTPETYGEACAPYLLTILAEQAAERVR